ncbi:aquaporin [Agromyces sp. S2-1-8]|uniref:aquaporin n=1 Tax=Agromyces sp. S2-1-8 TaxID=2897180 RepID=UPI001E463063|nr:aquaporin [Agromyces sp. S2-1-8]MCD5347743.1 aquaporin [Agromyces sp. S2-1-8]
MSDTAPAVDAPSTGKKLTAELLGTFILVFGVIGTAIFSAADGVGLLGVAFGLGLSVVVGIYAFGPISGGHFNPAVTLGLAIAGRFAWRDTLGYIVAQIVGGILGSVVLLGILSTGPKFDMAIFQGVSTGYDELSPGGFGLVSFFIAEIIATAVFLFVILGVTSAGRAASNLAPLAIGLTLTVLVLVAGYVTNGSFNPARSIATAIFGGQLALSQLWASIVAPIVGALLAGIIYKAVFDRPTRLTA